MYALRLQREYDDEDHALSGQRTQLAKSAQCLFECSICMEMPVDSIARINSCGHTFWRGCLRGHVSAHIDGHRFPVLCPTCTANKGKGKGKLAERTTQSCHPPHVTFFRGFSVTSPNPRAHRRAIQYMDRDGNGRIFRAPTL